MANFGDYYLNGSDLSTATAVFTNSNMTTLASAGYYSDGVVTRYQTASVGLGPVLTCPQCTDLAPSTIQGLSQNPLGLYEIYTNFGTDIGAIKVEAINLVITAPSAQSKPVGLFFLNTSSQQRYGRFSNRGGNTSTYSGPIVTADQSIPQYFWWGDYSSYCSNWSTTDMSFDKFEYNTQSDSYQATGNSIATTNANKIPTALANQTSNDTLITYIPKASATDFTLLSQLYLPCTAASVIVNVNAPVALSAISCSPGTILSHLAACGYSSTFVDYFHGPATTTVSSIINTGDFMFQDANASAILFDGYYKTSGVNLQGIAVPFGSFRVQGGVVTEIQAC